MKTKKQYRIKEGAKGYTSVLSFQLAINVPEKGKFRNPTQDQLAAIKERYPHTKWILEKEAIPEVTDSDIKEEKKKA